MERVIVNLDETNSLYDDDMKYIGVLQGKVQEAAETVGNLIRLKEAGFTAEDIVLLHDSGICCE